MAKKKGYLGLPWIAAVILAIIPITNIILGIFIRFTSGKLLMALLNIILFFVFYFVDLFSIIVNKRLKWLI